MKCDCGVSSTVKRFGAEVALHFPGLDGLKKPIVWVFPNVEVCLDCGAAEFVMPERELTVLRSGQSVDGVVASEGVERRVSEGQDEHRVP